MYLVPYLYIMVLSVLCSLFVALMSLTIGPQRSKMWLEAAVLTLALSMLVLTPVKIICKVMAVHLFAHVKLTAKTKCKGKKGKNKMRKKDAGKQEVIQHILKEAAPGLPRAQAAVALRALRVRAAARREREKQASAGTQVEAAELKPKLKKKRGSPRSPRSLLTCFGLRGSRHGRTMHSEHFELEEEDNNEVYVPTPLPLPLLFDAVRRLELQEIRATPPPHRILNDIFWYWVCFGNSWHKFGILCATRTTFLACGSPQIQYVREDHVFIVL